MEFHIDYEFALRIFFSFIVGTLIGIEREYQSKAAGLRTMIMICLGSTVFTEVSTTIDPDSQDRVASAIVTGVGFLGAGVIFKDGLTVTGLTTASTIWISAALGMAIGEGQYFVALVTSGIVLIVLSILEKATQLIEHVHQVRGYKISIKIDDAFASSFEKELKDRKLKFLKKRDLKEEGTYLLLYDISGSNKKLNDLNEYLKKHSLVIWYQY